MPYANNNEVNIYYEVEGEGPPLVLLHAFLSNLKAWRAQGYVDELKGNNQLILMDARGHGKSDKPHEIDAYDSEKRVGDVMAVLDALKIDSANYLGYSMGGRLGYEIAKYSASRVNSLIIGAATAAGEELLENNERLVALKKGMEALIDFGERMTGPFPPALKASILENDNLALLAVLKAGWPDTERYLPEMRMPFLLYAGELDPLFHPMEEVSKVLPDATFFAVSNANHMQGGNPDIVLPHVKEFLARVNE